ncbi:MAG: hypothetical protein M1819_000854 [Sarea resinae]|nr:MAG: hypothetical protein M1819_000854 [Sarea resinae]
MSLYGFKRAADDIRELAHQLNAPQIILGGHDWGGAVVYRVALWHPELVTHLFSVCTPYFPPSKTYLSTEQVVERLPNFTYQLQLSGPSVENSIRTKNRLRMFLRGLYGGLGPHGEMGFTVQEGVQLDKLELLGSSPLVSEKELDYYVDEYDHNGLHGPLNWYRTREVNYKDELQLTKRSIDIPVLFIVATKDAALPPSMSEGMEKYLPQLTRQSVDAGHWALWQAPEQVNRYIGGFLEEHGFGTKSTL